jgi:hypothetical protein
LYHQVVVSALGVALMHVPAGWRYLVLLGVVPSAAQLIGCAGVPESPEWLLSVGDEAGAKHALSQLRESAGALQSAWDELQHQTVAKACCWPVASLQQDLRRAEANHWRTYRSPLSRYLSIEASVAFALQK